MKPGIRSDRWFSGDLLYKEGKGYSYLLDRSNVSLYRSRAFLPDGVSASSILSEEFLTKHYHMALTSRQDIT
jgi:hypothetical protein